MEEEYKEYRKDMLKQLKAVEKEAGTKLSKRVVKSEDRKDSKRCDVARMMFREGIEMYECGDMSWEDMVDDLCKTLLAIEE
jgi:predicted AlkP superfamily phosphohydrolase/phosphomutase